jgi:hypothetical protein
VNSIKNRPCILPESLYENLGPKIPLVGGGDDDSKIWCTFDNIMKHKNMFFFVLHMELYGLLPLILV